MNCEFCPRPFAPSTKPVEDPCEILIVGESPLLQEINSGEPFPGPNGQLLRATLQMKGISESQLGFTNVVHCLQPRSTNRAKDKRETTRCFPYCRNRLITQIETRQPKIIVALGGFAMMALMNDTTLKITKCLGTEFIQPETGIKIVPVLHPAATTHNGGMFKDFEHGIQMVADTYKGQPKVNPGGTKYIVAADYNIAQVQEYIQNKIEETHLVAADIETTGLKYIDGHKIRQLGLCFKKNEVIIFHSKDSTYNGFLKSILEMPKPQLRWVWHNGKFDAGFIRYCWNARARIDEDTMLMHYALDERKGTHDLETCAVVYLGSDRWSEPMEQYWKEKKDEDTGLGVVGDAPQEVLDTYHAFDCDYTWQLYHKFNELLEKDIVVLPYKHILIPGSEFYLNLERHGIWVNPAYHDKVAADLANQIQDNIVQIWDIVKFYWDPIQYTVDTGVKKMPSVFNQASPKQLQWLLYTRLKLKTANKKKNTRAETLQTIVINQLQQSNNPLQYLPDLLLSSRKLRKLNGTYVEGLYKWISPTDARIHSSFLLHGTVTGRRASRYPNMQNIPRGSSIRSLFQAPAGRMLIEADYKSAELRCLCYVSRDGEMRRIFIEGLDLHDEMATTIFGPGWNKEQRVMAKTVNFGIPYGRGADSIARVFKVSIETGVGWIEAWFERFPEAARYIRGIRQAVVNGKVLLSPFGRKRRFQLTTPELLNHQQNEAVNFAISSMSGDLTLLSGIELDPILIDYKTFAVNEIHDSLVFEAPEGEYIEQCKHIARVMRQTPLILPQGDFVPFDVDIKIGQNWGEMKELDPEVYKS